MIKYIILAFTICYTNFASASEDPMPFNIEIGKTTMNQLVTEHQLLQSTPDTIKDYTKNMISINTPTGNSQIICIANPHGIIEAIIMKADKSYFEKLQQQLASKYGLVNSQVTNTGDRAMLFAVNDSYFILLRDIPANQGIEMVYSTRDLFVKRTANGSHYPPQN